MNNNSVLPGQVSPSIRKCVFLIGTRWFGVLGPCKEIIERLSAQGVEIYVFGQKDEHYGRYFGGNCNLVELRMRRTYFSPLSDLSDILIIRAHLRRLSPDVVHSFNPKPSLISYASLAFNNKPELFVGVTGLGNTFIRAPRLERLIVSALQKVCARARYVFFQNPDDIAMFKEREIVSDNKVLMFTGPGVDLEVFYPEHSNCSVERQSGRLRVGCTARLIWQKGIREYVSCATEILADPVWANKIEFYLFGEIDYEHPDRVDPDFIRDAVERGVIKHVPWVDDIASEMRRLDIFVLHSYREGAPRAILEASASALPTVGSDAVGVRELVVDGVTGYVTPLHDVAMMKRRILELATDTELRHKLGAAARVRIGEEFSLKKATASQLRMYESIGVV